MREVKNCPFCKGEVEIRTQGNDYSKKRSATMRCKNGCNINMKVSALTHNLAWCEGKLTERWNTRPVEQELLEALKEKEVEIKRLKDIRKPLIEMFEAFIDQYECDCGHSWCKPCADTTEALTAIKYAEICVAQDDETQGDTP